MTARDSDITPLDHRFPIHISQPPAIFWELLDLRPDRAAARGLTERAHRDASLPEVRYVTPLLQAAWADGHDWDAREDTGAIPAIAHDAKVDTGVGAFLAYHDEADAEAARTRRWARTLRAGRRRRS